MEINAADHLFIGAPVSVDGLADDHIDACGHSEADEQRPAVSPTRNGEVRILTVVPRTELTWMGTCPSPPMMLRRANEPPAGISDASSAARTAPCEAWTARPARLKVYEGATFSRGTTLPHG